jgi:hypothetical protein
MNGVKSLDSSFTLKISALPVLVKVNDWSGTLKKNGASEPVVPPKAKLSDNDVRYVVPPLSVNREPPEVGVEHCHLLAPASQTNICPLEHPPSILKPLVPNSKPDADAVLVPTPEVARLT